MCCGGGYKDGPNTDNDAYKKACSGDEYGTLDWALKKCSGEETCTWLHDWDCDGDNWRWCKGEIPHVGGKACTKTKDGPVCPTEYYVSTDQTWVPLLQASPKLAMKVGEAVGAGKERVDFFDSNGDIIFHWDPRPQDATVVRNSKSYQPAQPTPFHQD